MGFLSKTYEVLRRLLMLESRVESNTADLKKQQEKIAELTERVVKLEVMVLMLLRSLR